MHIAVSQSIKKIKIGKIHHIGSRSFIRKIVTYNLTYSIKMISGRNVGRKPEGKQTTHK